MLGCFFTVCLTGALLVLIGLALLSGPIGLVLLGIVIVALIVIGAIIGLISCITGL